jgi:hypothetical protein
MTPMCARCGCEVVGGYCTATPDYHRDFPLKGQERERGARPLTAVEWNRWRRALRPLLLPGEARNEGGAQ